MFLCPGCISIVVLRLARKLGDHAAFELGVELGAE